ncbi:sugar-binding transcriptional regulator [Aliiruegeria lutimaris]|uniref:DNA-binding transcriptional regulator LsrR, DeoR family n=1 Tax=Aliiruegeria lutimaris TaxID=571298 RepID=A0A1G8MRQ1_9RHOB|nr:sugar-binding domain-containing protein [Aliiruegeria lutimaris]SDI70728.1 DNA-binding transcriptional regulator LsrR, DeoR family [Aliiruegeria lutimaris]
MSASSFEPDLEGQLLRARIAWFYFVGGQTQQQVADRLGVTRLRVNRIIGQVRAEGSVVVDLRLPLVDCVALEDALRERFRLRDASVLPTLDDAHQMQRVIGEAAGRMVERHLEHHKGIGVGWGQTLSHVARCIFSPHDDLTHVVGLMGAAPRATGSNTIEVATAIANALGMECHYLTAPLYCHSQRTRQALLTDEELAATMHMAEGVEVALISAGDLSPLSSVMQLRRAKEAREALLELGAVGDILGCFLDAQGEIVDHPLNRTAVALNPAALRNKPVSVLASDGINKLTIIRASLRGGYVNNLVTDEQTALALLDTAPQER